MEAALPPAKSWVESANAARCEFPLQNLPYGVFSEAGAAPRPCTAIGDQILDLQLLERAGALRSGVAPVFGGTTLNAFMACPAVEWRGVREALTGLLTAGAGDQRSDPALVERALRPMSGARMHLPVFVRSFTDFYASRAHATNVGTMFRGAENALPPNWLHMPIGYNGRASSVVASATPIHRPQGQLKRPGEAAPRFGPCERLDFELELGALIGTPSEMGHPLSTAEAQAAIFGFVLLNDWSARDVQMWEYQPLGPFQSKAFATTISPWIVTPDALAQARCPGPVREVPLLPYLAEQTANFYDIDLEVSLTPPGGEGRVISRSNARHLYYSPAQQIAHHTSSGCPMETGDLIGSGTISGLEPGSEGSLLELSRNGNHPLNLGGGVSRSFVEDGDTITIRGWADANGCRIGFGACEGTILPAQNAAGHSVARAPRRPFADASEI